MTPSQKTIAAAGGLVWRMRDGAPDVLLIHRPRYDDWTLPKGKLLTDEPDLIGAVREVGEEVGAEVIVKERIGTVKYDVGDARKRVTYWSMQYREGDFMPNDEVDRIEWLRVGRAYTTLSHKFDRKILEDFASAPVPDSVLVLVRHAKAGKRTDWRGDDDLRPLDPNGERQARALTQLLPLFGPTRIYSADRTRCVQTVEPLAAALDLRVRVEPAFADETFDAAPDETVNALLALAKPGKVSVVCSQGLTIPSLIDRLGPGIRSSDTKKGAWWVLSLVDGEVVAADYYDAP
ncbi:MAG TPA: NUDIX hydrolase [Jatrophihabitantaceae bacterium]|jgi:8-oxo-dGTP diphosphatase